MPSALLLWMIAIEQLIHWPINWDRVWRFEIIASTGEADKQKTVARDDSDASVWSGPAGEVAGYPPSAETLGDRENKRGLE